MKYWYINISTFLYKSLIRYINKYRKFPDINLEYLVFIYSYMSEIKGCKQHFIFKADKCNHNTATIERNHSKFNQL